VGESADGAVAEKFVRTYLAKDWDSIRDQVTDRVRVRGLPPQFVQEALGPEGAIRLMSGWLKDGDQVDEIEILEVESVPFKERISVRYTAHSGDNPQRYLVEHHIFIQTDDDKVKKFDMGLLRMARNRRSIRPLASA